MITTQYMTSFTPEEMKLMVEQGAAKDARIAELEQQVAAAQERERVIVELLELDHCFDPHYSMHPVTREIRRDVAKVLGIAAALAAAQQEGK